MTGYMKHHRFSWSLAAPAYRSCR